MTVTYTGKVANARLFAFSRLLFYWRGSIYKLMYKEMLVFCTIYASLSLIYRLALNEPQKRIFEKIALHCDAFTNLIPLSFVLGFYVAICVGRWWNQYLSIPWPDRIMMYVTTMIDGADERGRIIRRTIMRYLSLSSLIVFQATSVTVKKRFPTMDHLLEAGVITSSEVTALDEVDTPHGKWWIPFVWACNMIKEAKKEGRIADSYLMKTLIDEVQLFRGNLGMLFSYDWISIPLVYTQVTTLAVYTFFLGCLFGRQFLDPKQRYQGHQVDLYIPAFTLLQFFFYMGWLKVAEQLINPFGEDDDDFEINWMIDRNLQVSLITTDDLHSKFPKQEKDAYFGDNAPECLPYTKSSVNTIFQPHMGSTADLSVSTEGMKVVNPMETIAEDTTAQSAPHHTGFYHSYHQTPLSSPSNTKRHFPNMLSGYHSPVGLMTPLNASKNEIDGLKSENIKNNGGMRHNLLINSVLSKTAVNLNNLLSESPDKPRNLLSVSVDATSKLHPKSCSIPVPIPPKQKTEEAYTPASSAKTNDTLTPNTGTDILIPFSLNEVESEEQKLEMKENDDSSVSVTIPELNVNVTSDAEEWINKCNADLNKEGRERHSSDDQSVDSSHSSICSATPLLKINQGNHQMSC